MLSTAVINGKSTLMYVSFEVNITSRVYYILLITFIGPLKICILITM